MGVKLELKAGYMCMAVSMQRRSGDEYTVNGRGAQRYRMFSLRYRAAVAVFWTPSSVISGLKFLRNPDRYRQATGFPQILESSLWPVFPCRRV